MNRNLKNVEGQAYFDLPQKVCLIKGTLLAVPDHQGGTRTRRSIWVNDREIFPEMGYYLRPFYDCDFGWGNSDGNMTFTTALTICLALFKEERLAENLFVCFHEEYVRYFPDEGFELEIDLNPFLKKYRERLNPNLYSRFCYSSLINSREILLYKDPLSGEISADLSENYAMHPVSVSNPNNILRKLNERKQRLLFRIFAKKKTQRRTSSGKLGHRLDTILVWPDCPDFF